MTIKDVNTVYIGNNGDLDAGIYPQQFEISGDLIFQPGLFGDEEEAEQVLEDFRASLKEAFSHVLDPVEYVSFDFEVEQSELELNHIHYHGESWEMDKICQEHDWDGPGWYFYDESARANGPFKTSDEASLAQDKYFN